MARITVEDCLQKVSNRFALIHLAAKRVRELRKGAEPLISSKNSDNVIALREIAAGKVFMAKTPEKTEPEEEAIETEVQTPSKEIDDLEKVFKVQKSTQTEVVEGPSEAQMQAPSEELDDSEIEMPDEEAFDEEAFDEEGEEDIEDPFDYTD
jgi:DNA-directed RNA polymerase subunit omega